MNAELGRKREWLRWRGPAAVVKNRPVLSSEKVLNYQQALNSLTITRIWRWAPDGD
jgi:hypothetical protein